MKLKLNWPWLCPHAFIRLLLLLASVSNAFAVPVMDNSATGIGNGFNSFVNKIDALTHKAISSPDFLFFVDLLFVALATTLIVWTIFKWVNKAAATFDIMTAVVLILMTRVLMASFDTLTSGIWQSAEGVGSALQSAMLGTGDLFFAPHFLANVLQSITWSSVILDDPFSIFEIALNMFALSAVMMTLSILSFVSAIWGFWGYTLAKLIGLLFMPTLLYERLSFLFDGWLRFFFGFVVYYIIARLNLVLVACAVALFLGLGLPPTVTTVATEIPGVKNLFEMLGLLTFTFVGILALFSTGRFAATIVSGSGGGGMGPAMLGAARMTAKMAGG